MQEFAKNWYFFKSSFTIEAFLPFFNLHTIISRFSIWRAVIIEFIDLFFDINCIFVSYSIILLLIRRWQVYLRTIYCWEFITIPFQLFCRVMFCFFFLKWKLENRHQSSSTLFNVPRCDRTRAIWLRIIAYLFEPGAL